MKILFLAFFFTVIFLPVMAYAKVKDADLAGSWYPGSGPELEAILRSYIDAASPVPVAGRVFALISPHAGYRFSGEIAGYGFKAVQAQKIKTVIVIGFSHRKYFNGISVYERGSFKTPLGEIPVDSELAEKITGFDRRISFQPQLFDEENSVEMQIPFIQVALKGVKIVPIAFGDQSLEYAELLAEALKKALADRDDYLIVASTDMSHFHTYKDANTIDSRTVSVLSKMKARDLFEDTAAGRCELCGLMPVTATLLAAVKLGFNDIHVLKYANSGDTYGGKDRVVGYLSAAIYKREAQIAAVDPRDSKANEDLPMLNGSQRKRLLAIARESITSYVRDGARKSYHEADEVLNRPLGAFVTLRENGELRGCIGNMVGHGPLYSTISNMAIEAATGDPRFPPLTPREIDKVELEISVLSPMSKVSGPDEIRIPGHGVMVKRGYQSGVYLPQVAVETGWNKDEFLTSLCGHKAGMAPDAWKDPATDIYVFIAEVFSEKEEAK